ncbi:MAG: hypothetical protein KDE20_20255 [Caldilineaceae bacterium]|nr:hypothetical protein [Caldilineaceae bacterium]
MIAAAGAFMLIGALLSAVLAQENGIIIGGEAACAAANGVWSAEDSTCDVMSLLVHDTTLSVPATVTVAVQQTFRNGDIDLIFPMPSMWGTTFVHGTTRISGTLVSYREGDNYDTLDNFGVLWLDGEFVNQYVDTQFCQRLIPYPSTCTSSSHTAQLNNAGRMLVFGHMVNEADFANVGELVVADAARGTIPPPAQQVSAASLSDVVIEEATAQLVNASFMRNEGEIENLGTVFVKSSTSDDEGRDTQGMLLNFGVIHNYGALGFDGSTALENRGMISNTGVLVLSGETYNGAQIVGQGAVVNQGDFLNIGRLDGLIYNEGRIVNAGIIDGSVLGPGELIELDQHQYLPLATTPGGS